MAGVQSAAEMEMMGNIDAAVARKNFDDWFYGGRAQEINDRWAKKRKRLDAKGGEDPSLRSKYTTVDLLEKTGNHKIIDQLVEAQKAARAERQQEGDEPDPLMMMFRGCNYITTGPACKHLVEKEPTCVKAVMMEEIEADDCSDVAELIKSHPALTELDLSSNKLGTEGAKTIAAAMKDNTTITSLDLSGCQIAQGAAKALAAYLETSPKLERLLLNGNQMKIYGTEDLMKGLRKNTVLTSLGLFFNGLGEDGIDKVLEVFDLPEGEQPPAPPEGGWTEENPEPRPNKNTTLLAVEVGDNKGNVEQEKKLAAFMEANNKLAIDRELERAKQEEFERLEREKAEAEKKKKEEEEAAAAAAAAAAAPKPGGKAAAGSGANAAKAMGKPDPKAAAKPGGKKAAAKPDAKPAAKPAGKKPGGKK